MYDLPAYKEHARPRERRRDERGRRPDLRAAPVPEPHGQEPGLPLERLRAVRPLRRDRDRDADQLGAEVRAGRSRRDRLLVDGRAPARPDRPELRDDRARRPDPVLARARRAGPRARLPLHRAARPRGTSARHPRLRARRRAGALVDGPLRRAARLPVPEGDESRDPRARRRRSRRAPGARARPGWTASRSTARTATSSRSSSRPRSTSATTSTAGRSRTARACWSRPSRRSAREVGDDFHLQVKISATELGNALMPWAKKGNTIEDSVQVAKWLEAAGPTRSTSRAATRSRIRTTPRATFTAKDVVATYDTMLSSGTKTFRNYVLFRTWPIYKVFEWRASRTPSSWRRRASTTRGGSRRRCRSPSSSPAGSSARRSSATRSSAGAATRWRSRAALIANNDLVRMFAEGRDEAPRPCTYCNKCLYAVLESPLGCYDERRYGSREEMVAEIMSVFGRIRRGWPHERDGHRPRARVPCAPAAAEGGASRDRRVLLGRRLPRVALPRRRRAAAERGRACSRASTRSRPSPAGAS